MKCKFCELRLEGDEDVINHFTIAHPSKALVPKSRRVTKQEIAEFVKVNVNI